jgi:hypothetical protein
VRDKLHSELAHLQKLQSEARWCEVFGGLSNAEQQEYGQRQKRISVLQVEIEISDKAHILQGPQPQIRAEGGTTPQRLTLPRLKLGSHIETVKGSLLTRSVIRQKPGTANRSLILETASS